MRHEPREPVLQGYFKGFPAQATPLPIITTEFFKLKHTKEEKGHIFNEPGELKSTEGGLVVEAEGDTRRGPPPGPSFSSLRASLKEVAW